MKLDIDQLKIGKVVFNEYVDMEMLLSQNPKKSLSRTRSAPVYISKDRSTLSSQCRDPAQASQMNRQERAAKMIACDVFSKSVAFEEQQLNAEGFIAHHEIFVNRFAQTHNSGSHLKQKSLYRRHGSNDSSLNQNDTSNVKPHSAAVFSEKIFVRGKRTESTIAGRFDNSIDEVITQQPIFEANAQQSITEVTTNDRIHDAVTKEPSAHDKINRQQPISCRNNDQNCELDHETDGCYRCLLKYREAVRCCTCMWCLDAACYHCYKDDIGYANWHEDMLSCQEPGAMVRNCKKWSLLSLATIALPCLLLYPFCGGSIDLCMKRRLKNDTKMDNVNNNDIK